MKRRVINCILIVTMVAVFLQFVGEPKAQATPSDETLLDAYRSYYDILRTAIDEYGIGISYVVLEDMAEYGFEAPTGVYYAELIDFENSGLPVLLYVFDDGTMFSFMFGSHCYVYGYNNRAERWFSGDIGAEGGYGSDVSIETSRSGLIHLKHEEELAASGDMYDTYYTVVNNEWVVSLERKYEDGFDFLTGIYNEARWLVNNNPVNERDYHSAPGSILGITESRYVRGQWPYPENTDAVYAVLAELEAKIAELERSSAPDSEEYDYDPLTPGGGFVVRPEVWRNITDASSANTAIYEAIASMSDEQRRSGDALDMAALFIETAIRAGASRTASGEVSLSSGVLSDLSGTAGGILASADSTLSHENVGLLRNLRTNISIRTEERERLVVSFPDDVSGIAFDNVTVDAEFASVTFGRNHIHSGGQVEVRRVDKRDGGESSDSGDRSGGSGNERSRESDSGGSQRGFWDNIRPIDFWSVIVIVVILVVWGVLAAFKLRLRAWVVPTFCALAVGINAFTIIQQSSNYANGDGAVRSSTSGSRNTQDIGADDSGGRNTARDDDPGISDNGNAIEVIMTEGLRATVSLPAVGGDRDYLVLFNEEGIPQYSKYNPVTDMIDTSIKESGIYTLREYAVSFIDVEQKNELMKEAVSQLASRGIMTGTTDGFFFPDKPITRAELVAAIVRAFDLLDPEATSTFSDISRSDWYYAAVATAEREGLIQGFEDNTFRGGIDIPKDQLVVITANTLVERMGYIVPGEIEELLSRFLDRGEIAAWSEGRIALATQSNILIYRTDSLFAPRSIMTRGDAAIVLLRTFNKVW